MTSLTRAAAACLHSLESLAAIGRALTDEQWHSRTACPDWTVADVYAHVIGAETWVADGAAPLTSTSGPQDWIDRQVDSWRGAQHTLVLDELHTTLERRRPQLTDQLPDPQTQAWSPLRRQPAPYARMLQMRAFDLWVHEQDVRRAVGRPGGLGSPGAQVAHDVIMTGLPRLIAKAAAAPPGSTIRITVLGELPADMAVHVDDDGEGVLVPAQGRPGAHATLAWDAFAQLSTGRSVRDAHQVWLGGDRQLAAHVLDHLNIAP